jgi:integrase
LDFGFRILDFIGIYRLKCKNMGLAEDKAIFLQKIKNGEIKSASVRPNLLLFKGAPARANLQQRTIEKSDHPDLLMLTKAAGTWADSSTNHDLDRARDVVRDKLRVVRLFFAYTEKEIYKVTPPDVQAFQNWLETERHLSARTINNYCSHLSGFFEWLLKLPELSQYLQFNPVRAARRKSAEPYQSQGTRSLSDEALRDLWRVMERKRKTGDAASVRDYAIFRFLAATGDRRAEILSLRGRDIEILRKGLIYYSRKKGGGRVGKTILDKDVVKALLDYIRASRRKEKDVIGCDVPLWLSHDFARAVRQDTNKNLSGQAFAVRMKKHAFEARIYNFHLHMIRHTFARIVSEDTGSLSDTQEALGHKNQKTTRIYVARIEIKSDAHSSRLKNRARKR